MPTEKRYKDSYMIHPAVKAYRDKFHKCPNAGLRRDIVVTVKDLALWLKILNGWRYQVQDRWRARNPMAVKEMLTEYERLSADAMERKSMQASSAERVSRRRMGRMPKSVLPPLLERSRSSAR